MELLLTNFAYLDPGTGSVIVQALIGGVAAVSFFFRHHVRVLFGKLFGKNKELEKSENKNGKK
jgi:hypothetical protein